jgi:hypothetical protein
MRKRIFHFLILVTLFGVERTASQPTSATASPTFVQEPVTRNLLYNKIVVFRRDQNALAGFFVGVNGDTLLLLAQGRQEKVLRQELTRLTLEIEKEPTRLGLHGVLLGIYLGNHIFYTAENQPMAYVSSGYYEDELFGVLLVNVLFAGVGGSVGYLAGLSQSGEKVFDFTGSASEQQATWQRFNRQLLEKKAARKVHLSVQAAHVYAQVSRRYRTAFEQANVVFDQYGFYRSENATRFNLLRKAQLTFSATGKLDFGIAVMGLGEPSLQGYKTTPSFYYGYLQQSFKATGYYVVGAYQPFQTRVKKRKFFHIGIGIGRAEIDFKLKAQLYGPFGFREVELGLAKTLFSSVIFAGVDLYLADDLSLGLSADHVFMPAQNLPALPELNIPTQELRLGNSSLGLTLGLHF